MIHTIRSKADLALILSRAEPHLKPIVHAVRHHDVGMMFVPQHSGAFRLPKGKPSITMIGDDMHEACGPDAFHMPSIRRAIRNSHGFAVISSCPQEDAYSAMALMTSETRRNTMIVETRPEQEIPWLGLIQKLAPKRFICLATVKGGHA